MSKRRPTLTTMFEVEKALNAMDGNTYTDRGKNEIGGLYRVGSDVVHVPRFNVLPEAMKDYNEASYLKGSERERFVESVLERNRAA